MARPHRLQTRYTEEQIERGLCALVLTGGNYRHAARMLAEHGFKIPEETLRSWKDSTHPVRYEQTRQRMLPRLQGRIAAESEDLAIAYAQKEAETLSAFEPSELEPRDKANAIRNLATARAISLEKAKLYRDQPTSISEQRPASEILKQLRGRAGAIDVEHEEIREADVVGAVPAIDAA